jgi:ligand-binding sensor domain-containing protein
MTRVKFKVSLFLAFWCSLPAILLAQERQLGTWKVFMAYGSSVGIGDGGDKVFSASVSAVFSYEKATGVIQKYDKATGLSEVGVKVIAVDKSANVFAIAYNNSNLDFVFNGTDVYNIADIKNQNLSGAVGINNLAFYGNNCYVSSDLGISVINLAKKEISNTYIIGSGGSQTKIYATSLDNQFIYAATQEGIKSAPLNSPNLQNFNNWTLYSATTGLPTKKAKFVQAYNNKVYGVIEGADKTDTLYSFDGTNWQKLYFANKRTFTSLKVNDNTLYFTLWNDSNTTAGVNGKIDLSETMTINPVQGHVRPLAWFESNGWQYEGDFWNGLFKNNQQGFYENVTPEGPFRTDAYDVNFDNDVLYVAGGGVDDSWAGGANRSGVYIFKDGSWTNINEFGYSGMNQYFDILATALQPARNKLFIASFWGGLMEYDLNDKTILYYDKGNSILEAPIGDPQRTKISSLTTDRNGNVWIGNSGAPSLVKMINTAGEWKKFNIPVSSAVPKKLMFDSYGQLWIPIRSVSQGLLVWDYNNTPDDPTDDKSRILNTGKGNGGLPESVVYSIAEDKDRNVWVGTGSGVAVFYCPGSVLSQNGCDADQIKVERDGFVGYLFGSEQVRAIAVDAANRKWIGTTNGVWLVSADGKEELLRFTVENSPLPSNQVTDIAINDKTGEVIIATLGGMASYQGDAVAQCTDCEDALVYPNPVRPDYDGPIAIKGLIEGAYVKIIDVSGTLVFQGRANGSQMIWNGKGYNGNRAASGVYTVISSTDLGKERRVAKILLMN